MTSNYIDNTGLHLQTLAEIVTELEDGFKAIYGTDINVDPNSPDGQMINLFAQSKIDILDLLSQIYGSFSPTSAIGVALDQRCAINGIARIGATYTTVNISVTTDREVNLIGTSEGTGLPFTVEDPSGNLFYLITSATGATGATSLLFTASEAGAIDVSPSTITKITTPTLGVVSVTNPSGAVNAGIDEESDSKLRYRRSVSVSNPSSGYLEGLQGALLAIDNVIHAKVFENNTSTTDGYGIPGHSIWSIVDYVGPTGATGSTGATGVTGSQLAIATEIYHRKSAGCGMTGDITEDITQVNGIVIPIKFSYATYQYLYIYLTMTTFDSSHTFDESYLKTKIYEDIEYDIYGIADYSAIASLVKTYDPYAVITSGGLSVTGATGATYPYLQPTTVDKRFIIQTANIVFNVV